MDDPPREYWPTNLQVPPVTSANSVQASIMERLMASWIDGLIVSVPLILTFSALLHWGARWWTGDGFFYVALALELSYLAVSAWLWGATVGKRV